MAASEVKVRKVEDLDLKLVNDMVHIEREAFGEGGLHNEWLMVPFIRHGMVFVAKYRGNTAGCAQFIKTWGKDDTAYLFGISMHRDYRGRGFGTDFLGQVLDFLRREGITKIVLKVAPGNTGAIRVYEKLGFVIVALNKDEYGPGEDRLIMECAL